jgi:hypothetical protein
VECDVELRRCTGGRHLQRFAGHGFGQRRDGSDDDRYGDHDGKVAGIVPVGNDFADGVLRSSEHAGGSDGDADSRAGLHGS